MKKIINKWMLFTAMLALLFLAACGSDNEETEPNEETETGAETAEENTNSEEEADTERTLTDAMGNEVTIPANPERVIASYLEDYLVALGITPVAQWSVRDGSDVQDYLQDSLADVPTIPSELPFEAVMEFEPDLIIMDSAAMVEDNKYEQYNKIAPTYVVGTEENNDWREELTTIGEVFGKEDQAAQVLADYEAKAEDAREQIQSAIGDESVAALWLFADTFYIVSENLSSGDLLYNDLGLNAPEVVSEISEATTANWSEISLEKLAELEAEHIFLVNSDGEGATMLEDPIWQNIPAVQNGNVYEFDRGSSWLYTGPIANSQMIDDALESLVE
ncbi:iron complex transport system substrate-binding protein [Gracilibacillus ureilyticus]|uniref:Iron complex transport system substrate-binding protein n=1 Tax=Gracilibacillus ureilyticus TaxID=531814 RepID=A0A1H9MSY1_9BACI|nr:iron-hydroxamate ABC transporter substrate-binding protein [Gracilibacillus ureilyticus]SER26820.1 iron complex transport system substrate-binding protein [Gracilibacillus ureilyticus]